MYYQKNSDGYKQVLAGIRLKTLVYGEKTSFCEFKMEKGSLLPDHFHPHEQTGYMVSGKMRLTIGEESFEISPGDSWCVPGDVRHQAEILADSIVVEVFSPVRGEYLPQNLG